MKKFLIGCTAAICVASTLGSSWILHAEEPRPQLDLGKPYLDGPMPDAKDMVPPPPAEGSARLIRDVAANAITLKGQDGPRWKLAARDADLSKGALGKAFSCAAGISISDATTPRTAAFLRRTTSDFGFSTSGVKALYQRLRPFEESGTPTCTPDSEQYLRGNGAYPSGHSAIGFGTGLVLASLLPARAATLVQRGSDYGDSRYLCNVHWKSDVEAARVIAAATYARLQANEDYRADAQAARTELSALAQKEVSDRGLDPQECDAEAEILRGA